MKSDNGTEFCIVDVIAHILLWIKTELLKAERNKAMVATDFDWVLTVPAIWRARGKQMMREASYKVIITQFIVIAQYYIDGHEIIIVFGYGSEVRYAIPPEFWDIIIIIK